MKNVLKSFTIFFSLLVLVGCGNSEKDETEQLTLGDQQENTTTKTAESSDPMKNKGIGPVDSVDLGEGIDSDMAARGSELFTNLCSACHKFEKKFVGPALAGVTERRTPEWIMNMILNPEQMIKEDPIAKQLLIESNMAMMADQGVKRDEARAILEYFRKYDQEN